MRTAEMGRKPWAAGFDGEVTRRRKGWWSGKLGVGFCMLRERAAMEWRVR